MSWTFEVDTREPKKAKDFATEKYKNAKLATLHAGDYAGKKGDNYFAGIERKALDDFVNAVATKRIFKQIEKLHETYPIVILALEGTMPALRAMLYRIHLEFNEAAFWGTLASIVVRDNFHIFWTCSQSETINMAYSILEKIDEGKYQTVRRWKPKNKNTVKDSLTIIPGVTDEIAIRLLQKHKTIKRICMLTQKELCSIKGIGPKLAKRIMKWFNGDL